MNINILWDDLADKNHWLFYWHVYDPNQHIYIYIYIYIYMYMLQVGFGVKSQTLVLGCTWVYSSRIKISPEKIQRHITNTVKIQQNAQSFYITHTLIYSPFIHSFIHSHHTTHASPMHHTFITHCLILCITHSSHCISTHHTMHTHHTSKTVYTTNHTDTFCS